MASNELNISTQTITPQMAKEWLAQNTHNRRISKGLVASLARDIKAGNWQLNGDAIRFNCDGMLIDGQHRLLACVAADAKIKSIVITNLPKVAQETLDSGRRRTPGDVLQLRGYSMANMMAATANRLMDVKNGTRIFRPTTSEVTAFVEARPNLVGCIENVYNSYPVYASVLGAVYYIGRHVMRGKRDEADAFIATMQTGEAAYDENPAHKFREKLIRMRAAKQTLRNWELLCSTLRIWDAFAQGETMKNIYFTDEMPDVHGFNRERI